MSDLTKIEITIIKAEYLVNLDIGKKQDPYVWFNFNGHNYESSIKYKAGKHAEWNESFKIQYTNGEKHEIKFMSFDKDLLSSDLIGKSKVLNLDDYKTGHNKLELELDGEEGEKTGTLNVDINVLHEDEEEHAVFVACVPVEGKVTK